jgi:hypothetical protein
MNRMFETYCLQKSLALVPRPPLTVCTDGS